MLYQLKAMHLFNHIFVIFKFIFSVCLFDSPSLCVSVCVGMYVEEGAVKMEHGWELLQSLHDSRIQQFGSFNGVGGVA